jgi:hypothetical protein
LHFPFTNNICTFEYNHLMELGIEGWKVTSHVVFMSITTRVATFWPCAFFICNWWSWSNYTIWEFGSQESCPMSSGSCWSWKKKRLMNLNSNTEFKEFFLRGIQRLCKGKLNNVLHVILMLMFNKVYQFLSLMLGMNSKSSTTIFLKIWPKGES